MHKEDIRCFQPTVRSISGYRFLAKFVRRSTSLVLVASTEVSHSAVMKMRELGTTSLLLMALCNCWWSFPVAESASGNQVLANGTIVFAPLPTNQEEFVPATYDAKGLDGYYAMSNGFTDVVRSGTLPYGERCEGEGGERS